MEMTAYSARISEGASRRRRNLLLLLLFFSGAALGCLFVGYFDLSGRLFPGRGEDDLLQGGRSFASALLWNLKFLLVLFLLAFTRLGALLIPPMFALEGLTLGTAAGCVLAGQGWTGLAALALLLLFRLALVLPYGFVLGSWAIEQSLRFGDRGRKTRSSGPILLLTLALAALAAFLECTLARWLGGMYFLKFGV